MLSISLESETNVNTLGFGVKEAKDAVEALAAKHGISPKGACCAGMVLLMVAVFTITVVGLWVLPG